MKKIQRLLLTVTMLFSFSQVVNAREIGFDMIHLKQVNCSENIGCYTADEEGKCIDCGWKQSKICGPVSVLLAAASVGGFTPTYDQIKDLVDWMVEVDIYTSSNYYNGEMTNSTELVRIMKEYFDISAEWIGPRDKSFNKSIALIADSLNREVPVILGTYFNLNIFSTGHFLCANKLRDNNNDGDYIDDDDQIFVTDPAHEVFVIRTGYELGGEGQKWYAIKQLRTAWNGVLIIHEESNSDNSSCFINCFN